MKKCISAALAGLTLPVSLISVAQTDLTSLINTTPLAPYTVSQVSDAGVQTTDTAQNELKYYLWRRFTTNTDGMMILMQAGRVVRLFLVVAI